MDYTSTVLFLFVTFLFSLLVAFILKYFVFRFVPVPLISSTPYWGWVVFVIAVMMFLQGAGVDVSGWYAKFFEWLASQLRRGVFQIG